MWRGLGVRGCGVDCFAVNIDISLVGSHWQFGNQDRITAPFLTLGAGGQVRGYNHPYERRWGMDEEALCFFKDDGTLTSRLLPDERGIFSGNSLMNPRVSLVLTPVDWEGRARPGQLTRRLLAEDIKRYGWDIGDHTYGRPQVFERLAALKIGKFTSIASGVQIALGNHRLDSVSSYPFSSYGKLWPSAMGGRDHGTRGDVTIGNDVWLAASCFIGSGVTIGDGAVVGAHAVVTRDVAPYMIVAGNPAREVRLRFDIPIVEALLDISWWDWSDERIDEAIPLMLSDVSAFVRRYRGE